MVLKPIMVDAQPDKELVREHLSLIAAYVFSQPAIGKWLEERFAGEWPALADACIEAPKARATHALRELAMYFRALDNQINLSAFYQETNHPPLGIVIHQDGTRALLYFDDMLDKILLASRYEWILSNPDHPLIECYAANGTWEKAQIHFVDLAYYCSEIMNMGKNGQ